MSQSAMPVLCRALVPEVLPAVMPDLPAVPEVLPFPLPTLVLPLIAGMAGDGELDAAGEWAAAAPEELLVRLGAPLDKTGKARRPDATTLGRSLADGADQGQYDDALCAWAAARARAMRPGMRRHLRIDGKALRGAARGRRAPMLLSGIWGDGTTAAQLPVDVSKTNEIPVFRQLVGQGSFRGPRPSVIG